MKNIHKKPFNEKQRKERNFLLVLPVLIMPFLCLAFYALGGGQGISSAEDELNNGLNLSLPEASIEGDVPDKLETYEQAERKATRVKEQRRMDPFADVGDKEGPVDLLNLGQQEDRSLKETENTIREKLTDLENIIAAKEIPVDLPLKKTLPIEPTIGTKDSDPGLQRLEAMMASVVEPDIEDPEMVRIDALLDKLLDVQHPQRVEERLNQLSAIGKSDTYSVSTSPESSLEDMVITRDAESGERKSNGFYTLEQDVAVSFSEIKPAISAQVTTDQEIVNGASIEMELSQPVYIKGEKLPKGTTLTGTCFLDGERLKIQVQAIRSGNLIIPVNLEAVDLDALPGIRIPSAISRDAVKQGAGEGIESMNMMTMSPLWEAQASMAGMEAVKGIFSKKAKRIKVKVKAGHPLLLADISGHY